MVVLVTTENLLIAAYPRLSSHSVRSGCGGSSSSSTCRTAQSSRNWDSDSGTPLAYSSPPLTGTCSVHRWLIVVGCSLPSVDVPVILISAGVGVVASVLTSYATAHLTARQELRRWRTEMAEKYASLVADQPASAQALARQFAIGVLILERGNSEQREKIFIAPHTRITAGRSESNELVLLSPAASQRHFAVSADGSHAYVEDLGSTNGVYLNDHLVSTRTILHSGDVLRVDSSSHIEFQALASNM
jgi:hypothetical protein